MVVAVVVVRAGLSSQPRIVLRMRRAPNRESAWHNRWRDPNRTRDDNQYEPPRRVRSLRTRRGGSVLKLDVHFSSDMANDWPIGHQMRILSPGPLGRRITSSG